MKKIEIKWDELDAMLQFGPSQRFVCEHFGINPSTIERHIKEKTGLTFAEYKDEKMDKVRLKLQQTAIQMALKKDRTMLIFCLKNLCKWSDNNKEEITISDIKVIQAIDESDL